METKGKTVLSNALFIIRVNVFMENAVVLGYILVVGLLLEVFCVVFSVDVSVVTVDNLVDIGYETREVCFNVEMEGIFVIVSTVLG